MDLYKAIQDLYAEKEKLERVIAALEELQRTAEALPIAPKSTSRRGRKSMSPEERQEVSERMKNYWAGRRQTPDDGQAEDDGR
jgi:DNA-binding SARP family transcriptional activator